MTELTRALNPVDDARRIGTVTVVGAQWVTINLPNAGSPTPFMHYGETVPRGEVGEYVCFPRGNNVILGRITKVELPERDRLFLEPKVGKPEKVDPIGSVSLLTDVDLVSGDVSGAVCAPPRLGTPAYSVSSSFLQWVLESSARKKGEAALVALCIGDVVGVTKTPVSVSPERLFGRHCAVLGVTGGGKSWTIARLIEECAQHKCKVVLVDATGEFATLDSAVMHCSIGSQPDEPSNTIEVSCPHNKLEEQDLFAFFTPSGQSQAPALREAIRSLKLAKCVGSAHTLVANGCIPKALKLLAPYQEARLTHANVIELPQADFEIAYLPEQIKQECIYPVENGKFGRANDNAVGYCLPLIMRIESILKAEAMAPIFKPSTLSPKRSY